MPMTTCPLLACTGHCAVLQRLAGAWCIPMACLWKNLLLGCLPHRLNMTSEDGDTFLAPALFVGKPPNTHRKQHSIHFNSSPRCGSYMLPPMLLRGKTPETRRSSRSGSVCPRRPITAGEEQSAFSFQQAPTARTPVRMLFVPCCTFFPHVPFPTYQTSESAALRP